MEVYIYLYPSNKATSRYTMAKEVRYTEEYRFS